MSTVAGIVRGHKGFMEVTSKEGSGTTFMIYLPAKAVKSESEGAEARPVVPRGHGELIMVEDDEAPIREILQHIIEAQGYAVVAATDGIGAVALYAQHQDAVKLVITDFMMPNMDGAGLIRVLKRFNPLLPIIVSTGAGNGLEDSGQLREMQALGIKHILAKPYSTHTVLELIHELIGKH